MNEIMTVEQVAEELQCSRAHVYALMDKGLKSFKIGASRRIRRSALEAFIERAEKQR